MEDEVMTLADASELLRLSKTALYRLAERGELPGAVKIGGQWRVSRAQLLAGVGLGSA
jgi:excisionase family DNA binding protein